MDKPILKNLENKSDCRYALVVAISKRARMLVDKSQSNQEDKPVIQSMKELSEDKYTYSNYDKN